ncbi:MAG: hypothetical protein IT379_34005 [Deltaproteobacteria bacterium]|nr:hypothetical protein [Deltaproteobacteria bacterium]
MSELDTASTGGAAGEPTRRAARRLGCVVCVIALSVACGGGDDDTTMMPTPDAARPDTGPVDEPDGAARDAGSTVPVMPPSAEPCAEGMLCLTTERRGSGIVPAGRLAVFWVQMNDDLVAPPPEVVYEEPFDPTVGRIEIPLAHIAPPSEAYLWCERDCPSTYDCDCASELRIGIGFVGVVTDADDNGRITGFEVLDGSVPIGIAGVVLVHGPPAATALPDPLHQMFPDGLAPGLMPYRVEASRPFDTLRATMPGETFPLFLCTLDQSCELPYPNLS